MRKELQGLKKWPDEDTWIESLRTIEKVINWKTADRDDLHRFWFRKFRSIYNSLAFQLNRCLEEATIPECMIEGKTTLILKDFRKRTILSSYRPITCLPIISKIIVILISKLLWRGLFPKEHKGFHEGARGTGDLLYIDQYIFKESKARRKKVAMAWIGL